MDRAKLYDRLLLVAVILVFAAVIIVGVAFMIPIMSERTYSYPPLRE